jgi:hypothetical protein
LGWTHAKQASGAAIDATIPELELAVAYRPPLPSSLPGSEGRVFVAPALALTSGTPAVDGGRDWTVTTGVGWGLYGHVGRMLLGTSWDFGLTWPAPVEALDPNDRSWTRRVMMRMSLYAGFEAGGG